MTLLTHVGSYCANGAVLFIDNQLYILLARWVSKLLFTSLSTFQIEKV